MTRKRCKRKVWSISVDVIGRAIESVRVTPESDLNGLRTIELLAIDAFAKGIATPYDFRHIADMMNIAETLVDMGIGAEVRQVCADAQAALLAVHARHEDGKGLVLRGPELTAFRDLYAWHEAQRTAISRAVYEKAIERTTNRVRSGHPSLKVL